MEQEIDTIEAELLGCRWNGDLSSQEVAARIRSALSAAGLVIVPREQQESGDPASPSRAHAAHGAPDGSPPSVSPAIARD